MTRRRAGNPGLRRPSRRDGQTSYRVSIKTGRGLAFLVLRQHDLSGRFLSELFAELDESHSLSRQERGLAVDIAAGVIRRRRTIDLLLQLLVERPRADVEPDLWCLLQVGAVQLVFGRTPQHAAVHATVELARTSGLDRWAAFANGVLRNLGRLLTETTVGEPARNALPAADGQYLQLATDVFSCPVTNPADYFGEAFSMPRAIARRWHGRMAQDDLVTAGFHSHQPPAIVLRVNPLRATAAGIIEALDAQGIATGLGATDEAVRLVSSARVESLPGYSEGYWSVQDESAMEAARMLNPVPGETILDLCAAPGGKTTHLAELSGDRAKIVACDVNERRLQRVTENALRLKLSSITAVSIHRDGDGIPDAAFDAALVDAPCSNSGVFARRPEARWRFREADLAELRQLQTRLLMTAFDHVRPGGRIVYSTCSIEPEETTQLVHALVEAVPAMTLQAERLLLPGQPADGGYIALLRRSPISEVSFTSVGADKAGPVP